MKIVTSIKLDKDVKERAGKLASELGLNLSVVVNATLKQFINERRVSFSLWPELNKKTEQKFLKIRDDIKKGKNLSKGYSNSDELFKALKI